MEEKSLLSAIGKSSFGHRQTPLMSFKNRYSTRNFSHILGLKYGFITQKNRLHLTPHGSDQQTAEKERRLLASVIDTKKMTGIVWAKAVIISFHAEICGSSRK